MICTVYRVARSSLYLALAPSPAIRNVAAALRRTA